MPAKLSDILMGYKKALDVSRGRFEEEYSTRYEKGIEFYEIFFNSLIKLYHDNIENPSTRRLLKKKVEQFFGTDDVRFAAIDGTLYKEQMGYYIVFFGASYGVRGEVKLVGDPPQISYERWSVEEDKSMVAYVPIPFAEIGEVSEKEQFIASDDDRIDLSSIHRLIMLLAEVYLGYDLVKTSSLRPKLLLWDQSITSILMHTDIRAENIDLIGHPYLSRPIRKQDVIIAYSHPYNRELDTPSSKLVELYNWVLRKLEENKGKISIENLVIESGITEDKIKEKIKNYLIKSDSLGNPPIINIDKGEIHLHRDYKDSWRYIIGFFENTCERLFKDKDQTALIYDKEIDGEIRKRWMSPDDLRFLIAVGLRALIELCWRYDVLFIGIAKDSSGRYLTKNYLGVLRYVGKYNFDDVGLPWTDRMYLETLPLCDDELRAPWTTIEFDSIFTTLRLILNEEGENEISGVSGYITTPERIILKSLAQFYINKEKEIPLTGHVIFIDRLAVPRRDKMHSKGLNISSNKIGNIFPLFYEPNNENFMQDITIFLLNILTRNLYPEVIGYPDPLHKADWGAKSLLKKVRPMINTSGKTLKHNPMFKTFRQLRNERRRT